MKRKITLVCLAVLAFINMGAQDVLQLKLDYVEKYKDIAINEMRTYRIPASITLAQGIHESNIGRSRLATKANNHFGIKCHKGWTGKSIRHDDDRKNECFRKYKTAEESYRDHSEFLTTRDRYRFLFDLDIHDYKGWAYGLKAAGYATNPKYPALLIRIIEELKLYEYDQMKGFDPIAAEHIPTKPPDIITEQAVEFAPYKPSYQFLSEENFKQSGYTFGGRKVYTNNEKTFVFAFPDENIQDIAQETKIKAKKLIKYNELQSHQLLAGQMIYLERKRASNKAKTYTVKQQDTMYSIAQAFGVRLRRLYAMNKLPYGSPVMPGTEIRLR